MAVAQHCSGVTWDVAYFPSPDRAHAIDPQAEEKLHHTVIPTGFLQHVHVTQMQQGRLQPLTTPEAKNAHMNAEKSCHNMAGSHCRRFHNLPAQQDIRTCVISEQPMQKSDESFSGAADTKQQGGCPRSASLCLLQTMKHLHVPQC